MTGSWELGMHECCRNSDGIIDDIQLTFLITVMWKAREASNGPCKSGMPDASGKKYQNLLFVMPQATWVSWENSRPSILSLFNELVQYMFPNGRMFLLPTRFISLDCCLNMIRSLAEPSTFLRLTRTCWRWWHPFCLLGENRWAALAEKFHTKCKYSTLLFLCLRLFWLYLLFPLL